MLKIGPKSIFTLFVVCTLWTCIDPYTPTLTGYESLLVVDGVITDENSSYTIKLSRTIQEQDAVPVAVSNATVYISDETDNRTYLAANGPGIYKTDSIEFIGTVGKTYKLHVLTPEGDEYESEPCSMQSVPDIDSIYYEPDQEMVNNGTETEEGLRIRLDASEGDNNNYYRWDFEETWKFKVPTVKKYDYFREDSIVPVPVSQVNEFCWKSRKSDEVLIRTVYSELDERVVKEPIFFIATARSNRLLIKYSILVRQYSISKAEYDFWDNLKNVNESGNDIFATQPFPVISNIRNVNDPDEQVLGYFQVSAVKEKRIFISIFDIVDMDLPYYQEPCERIELAPEDVPMPEFGPPLTWDGLYKIYCINSDYYFVEPKYEQGTSILAKLIFSRPECADCKLTGTLSKPDFWEE